MIIYDYIISRYRDTNLSTKLVISSFSVSDVSDYSSLLNMYPKYHVNNVALISINNCV